MIHARIYRPSKTAMQSGKSQTHQWILEFYPTGLNFIEPVMGWRGSNDTCHQIRLTFPSLELALAYAEKNKLTVQVEKPHLPYNLPKRYSDNFRYDRVE